MSKRAELPVTDLTKITQQVKRRYKNATWLANENYLMFYNEYGRCVAFVNQYNGTLEWNIKAT